MKVKDFIPGKKYHYEIPKYIKPVNIDDETVWMLIVQIFYKHLFLTRIIDFLYIVTKCNEDNKIYPQLIKLIGNIKDTKKYLEFRCQKKILNKCMSRIVVEILNNCIDEFIKMNKDKEKENNDECYDIHIKILKHMIMCKNFKEILKNTLIENLIANGKKNNADVLIYNYTKIIFGFGIFIDEISFYELLTMYIDFNFKFTNDILQNNLDYYLSLPNNYYHPDFTIKRLYKLIYKKLVIVYDKHNTEEETLVDLFKNNFNNYGLRCQHCDHYQYCEDKEKACIIIQRHYHNTRYNCDSKLFKSIVDKEYDDYIKNLKIK